MQLLLKRTQNLHNSAIRIGICGAPGSGKSSLIEKIGLHLTREHNKKLEVLAIDPSS
jgi:LAO/AO transport system kinase